MTHPHLNHETIQIGFKKFTIHLHNDTVNHIKIAEQIHKHENIHPCSPKLQSQNENLWNYIEL